MKDSSWVSVLTRSIPRARRSRKECRFSPLLLFSFCCHVISGPRGGTSIGNEFVLFTVGGEEAPLKPVVVASTSAVVDNGEDSLSPGSAVCTPAGSIGLNLGFRVVGVSLTSSPSAALSRSQNILTTFTPTPRNGSNCSESREDARSGECREMENGDLVVAAFKLFFDVAVAIGCKS